MIKLSLTDFISEILTVLFSSAYCPTCPVITSVCLSFFLLDLGYFNISFHTSLSFFYCMTFTLTSPFSHPALPLPHRYSFFLSYIHTNTQQCFLWDFCQQWGQEVLLYLSGAQVCVVSKINFSTLVDENIHPLSIFFTEQNVFILSMTLILNYYKCCSTVHRGTFVAVV